ncbi:7595_t:CDS:2, partial [Gigaspora rosea]
KAVDMMRSRACLFEVIQSESSMYAITDVWIGHGGSGENVSSWSIPSPTS